MRCGAVQVQPSQPGGSGADARKGRIRLPRRLLRYMSRLLTLSVRKSGTEYCAASGSCNVTGKFPGAMTRRSKWDSFVDFPQNSVRASVFSPTSSEVWRAFFPFSGTFGFLFDSLTSRTVGSYSWRVFGAPMSWLRGLAWSTGDDEQVLA